MLYGDLGKDFSTVNLQAKFRKFLFGDLEVVVVQTEFSKSKLLYGDLGKDFSTVNLQAEFRKFLFGYLEVVVAPAN